MTGPAVMPSGGLLVSARYSWRRRRWAVDWAILDLECGGGGEVGGDGDGGWGLGVE